MNCRNARTCLLLVLWLYAVAVPAVHAQLPEAIAYQGYLTDSEGTPIDQEDATLTFRLYDAAQEGRLFWIEEHTGVAVTEGVFSVNLGAVDGLDRVSFDRPMWLSVAVGDRSADELAPRVPLAAAPYALSLRGLHIREAQDPSADGPSIIGGFGGNSVGEGVVGATVAGGGSSNQENTVEGDYGTTSGGRGNEAQGAYATVSGGQGNEATSEGAAVAGGRDNEANEQHATVAGGKNNFANGGESTVGGGDGNFATGDESTIGGGFANRAAGWKSTVGGGGNNETLDNVDAVGGGSGNIAEGPAATVSGGIGNTARGRYTTVGGGVVNRAGAEWATVPGGVSNHARGVGSFAAGHFARAIHEGSFVWSDNSLGEADSLVTTDRHQFLIRAAGGVGIGTNVPTSPLTVAGTIESTEGGFMLPDGTVLADAADLDPSAAGAWTTAMDGEAVVTSRKVGIGLPYPSGIGNAGLELVGRVRIRPRADLNRGTFLIRPGYSVQDESSTFRVGVVADTTSRTQIAGLQMDVEPDGEGFVHGSMHLVTGTQQPNGGVSWGRRITITNDGTVGIGDQTPAEQLEVDGNVQADDFLTASDARLKRQVEELEDAAAAVQSLRGVTFHWKDRERAEGARQIGFIAQEVERVLPEIVHQDGDGIYKVAYAKLVPVLVEAFKAQQQEIDALRDELRALRADLQTDGSRPASTSHTSKR